MNKTDKELTIEVVNTFIQSWNAKDNTAALKTDHVADMIKSIYNAIHDLPSDQK